MLRRQMQLDFSGIKTYSAEDRHNLVTIDNMMTPGVTPHEAALLYRPNTKP